MRSRHTLIADPLSMRMARTHLPSHFMVMCKGLLWYVPSGGRSFSVKARVCLAKLGVIKAIMASGVTSAVTSNLERVLISLRRCS